MFVMGAMKRVRFNYKIACFRSSVRASFAANWVSGFGRTVSGGKTGGDQDVTEVLMLFVR